jgi:hypothetical protein
MTRARHVTPFATAERLERMRTLITALQVSDLSREEIGSLLCVSPSGVRKYLADLAAKVRIVGDIGNQVCRLTLTANEAQAYLESLAVKTPARPAQRPRSEVGIAMLDSMRRFHIMQDDEHYTVRVHRGAVARDPLVTALFGDMQYQLSREGR